MLEVEKAMEKRRALHRALSVEQYVLRPTQQLCFSLNLAVMAIAYAVSNSRLVVDLLLRAHWAWWLLHTP